MKHFFYGDANVMQRASDCSEEKNCLGLKINFSLHGQEVRGTLMDYSEE